MKRVVVRLAVTGAVALALLFALGEALQPHHAAPQHRPAVVRVHAAQDTGPLLTSAPPPAKRSAMRARTGLGRVVWRIMRMRRFRRYRRRSAIAGLLAGWGGGSG